MRNALPTMVLMAGLIAAGQPATALTERQGEDFPDGVYVLLSDDEPGGVKRRRADTGQIIRIGKQVTDQLGQAALTATNNANTEYRLSLRDVGPVGYGAGKRPRLAICAGGVCAVAWSRTDPDERGRIELNAAIHGEALADRAATALGTEPAKRSHPGHQMRVTWTPLQDAYGPRDPVIVRLRITNVGHSAIRFKAGGMNRGARDNQFGFIASRSFGENVPDTGDPNHFGGKVAVTSIAPGDYFEKEVDLRKWFAFDQPGNYGITGLYYMPLTYSERFEATWDDHAAGRFTVEIKAGPAD